jgi:microcystin-dependent protein
VAFNPIDSSTIEAGDAVTQELFTTIKDDLDDHESRVATLELTSAVAVLTGEVRMYGSSVAPTGWLNCDGSAISRTTYASLFAVLGTQYGVGDGLTTFNLPDIRSRAPIGLNAAGGGGLSARIMGEKYGSESVNLLHNHQWYTQVAVGTDGSFSNVANPISLTQANEPTSSGLAWSAGGSQLNANFYTNNALSGTQDNNQPSICINFIIKT